MEQQLPRFRSWGGRCLPSPFCPGRPRVVGTRLRPSPLAQHEAVDVSRTHCSSQSGIRPCPRSTHEAYTPLFRPRVTPHTILPTVPLMERTAAFLGHVCASPTSADRDAVAIHRLRAPSQQRRRCHNITIITPNSVPLRISKVPQLIAFSFLHYTTTTTITTTTATTYHQPRNTPTAALF